MEDTVPDEDLAPKLDLLARDLRKRVDKIQKLIDKLKAKSKSKKKRQKRGNG